MSIVNYSLDGVSFGTYGINVSSSSGVIDAPKRKECFRANAPNRHGEVVDLSDRYYEPREINLECWIKGDSNEDLAYWLNVFKQSLGAKTMQRLMITLASEPTKPLVYQVYNQEGITVKKTWREQGAVMASFTLKLIEPEPYKMVLKSVSPECIFLLNSTSPVNIYWGNGGELLGTLTSTGNYYIDYNQYFIVITGNIDDVTISLLDGAEIVWNKLL